LANRLILVTGGARSGKSSFAVNLATQAGGEVLFVATARAGDEEMVRRIAEHQASRPAHWRTLEAPRNVGTAIKGSLSEGQFVILDCLGVLVSNILMDAIGDDADACQPRFQSIKEEVIAEIESLVSAFRHSRSDFVVVTNEVGEGLVPPYPLGRAFRDLVGMANQSLAAQADEVYLLVCGIPVEVKRGSEARS